MQLACPSCLAINRVPLTQLSSWLDCMLRSARTEHQS